MLDRIRLRRLSFLKPSDECERGGTFPTIKISEPNETIPLDVVHSLLAALPLRTTEVCALQPVPLGPAALSPSGASFSGERFISYIANSSHYW